MLAFRVPPRRPFGPPGARPARPVRAPPGAVRGASAVCSAVSAPSRLRASPPPSAARLRLAGGGARSSRPGLRPASRPAGPVPRRSASSLAPLASACRRGASPVARGLPPPPPPRLRRPPFPLVWGGGRGSPRPRGSFALPSARAASCCRPCFAPGAARPPARLRLWRGPPFRPAPAGRLRPRSSAPGGRRRPCGAASWPLRGPPAL